MIESMFVQVTRILDAIATEDAARGWRQGGRSVPQQRKRHGNSSRQLRFQNSSTSGGAASTKSLVAIPTANVWEKTQLLLHSLAANSDHFEVMVSLASHPKTPCAA